MRNDSGLGDAVKRIEGLEKKFRKVTEIENTVKTIGENTDKNAKSIDTMLNFNI